MRVSRQADVGFYPLGRSYGRLGRGSISVELNFSAGSQRPAQGKTERSLVEAYSLLSVLNLV